MFWKSFYADDIQPEIQVAPPPGVEPRNTCTIKQRVYSYPIAPYVIHKSVEFSGVGSLRWPIRVFKFKHVLRRRAIHNTKSRMYIMFGETIIAEVSEL